ncbi:MAG TPA: VWA domain-containing protein [Terriglobia bacterium]|nr:VWA domain-containing protein [Terriglobia bacterium]
MQTERNLVMVRVVVRDAKGAAVDNLRQEDFQLFDHGKLQTILHFSLEKPALKAPGPSPQKPAVEPEATDETAMPAAAARRFVGLYFDDVNSPYENLARARDAADHFLSSSVQAGDRVGLFTSSGQKQIDFTEDLVQIHQALLDIRARPIIENKSCGAIPPYEAYLIVDHHDETALAVATAEILNCNPCPADNKQDEQQCLTQAQNMAQNEATQSLSFSETQSNAALRGIESLVRRLTSLPGQRSVVIVSGGFLTDTLLFELSQIADRALRAGIIISAIDARGLYSDATFDASQSSFANSNGAAAIGQRHTLLVQSARRQTDGMQTLALDTGGIFFENSNDLEAGFRKAAGLPEAFYLLAFSPQNLKLDGAFHPLQVKLVSAKGLSVQARKGYYAPRKPNDPAVQEKEEIREAVFSQDETHELPIDVHTQFFMKSETDARISVLTRIDLRQLHFRKDGDRNLDNLTFVTVVFDQDGHVVSAQQKSVNLHLRDGSLERYMQTGISSRSLIDVKPGTYLVRAIVRDSESGQISGLNRTVEIPY